MIATVQDGENLRVLTIINIGNDLGKNRARFGTTADVDKDMKAVQAVVEQLKNSKAEGVLY